MEELSRIKRHINLQGRLANDLKRADESSAEAQAGKRLIQRVISAARLASEKSKMYQERHPKQPANEQRNESEKSERNESLMQVEVPEIYVENDIDGLCYIGGPRRKSLRDGNHNNTNNQDIKSLAS